jgi:hypothetical protein
MASSIHHWLLLFFQHFSHCAGAIGNFQWAKFGGGNHQLGCFCGRRTPPPLWRKCHGCGEGGAPGIGHLAHLDFLLGPKANPDLHELLRECRPELLIQQGIQDRVPNCRTAKLRRFSKVFPIKIQYLIEMQCVMMPNRYSCAITQSGNHW